MSCDDSGKGSSVGLVGQGTTLLVNQLIRAPEERLMAFLSVLISTKMKYQK